MGQLRTTHKHTHETRNTRNMKERTLHNAHADALFSHNLSHLKEASVPLSDRLLIVASVLLQKVDVLICQLLLHTARSHIDQFSQLFEI